MLCTSGFTDDAMFHSNGQNQARRHAEKRSSGVLVGRQTTTAVWLSSSECDTGAKSAIYDCLVCHC